MGAGMLVAVGATVAGLTVTPPAGDVCTLTKTAELAVEMVGGVPTVAGSIHGKPFRLVIATNGTRSALTETALKRLGLNAAMERKGTVAATAGKVVPARGVWLHDFTLGGVAGGRSRFGVVSGDAAFDGTLGNDFFHDQEIEFDFAAGALRLFNTDNCERTWLAYWSKDATVAPLRFTDVGAAMELKVNGHVVEAELATERPVSVLSMATARMAGMGPDAPGAQPGGLVGAGQPSWFVPVDFASPNQPVDRTMIRVADVNVGGASDVKIGSNLRTRLVKDKQMELGADFFAAHRVLLSQVQRRLYISYAAEGVAKRAAITAEPEPGVALLRVWAGPDEADADAQ